MHLAIAMGAVATAGDAWLIDWFTYRVLWEVGAGVVAGWLIGRASGWLTFHVPAKTKMAKTGDGLIALSATLVSYGRTEIIHCYGFLAVFVTALAFRGSHREHDFHIQMHEITEQVERIAMMLLLLLFGGALVAEPADSFDPADTHHARSTDCQIKSLLLHAAKVSRLPGAALWPRAW